MTRARLTTLGAIVGLTAWMTLSDRFFHLATGTVVHFWSPFMGGGQTVWVLVCFGLGAAGIVATAPRFAVAVPRPSRFVIEILVMTAVYASSGLFGAEHRWTVLFTFSVLFLVRLAGSGNRGQLVAIALMLAVAGPAFESLQWHLGMFEYTHPDVLGVPWWLFPFYANGAWAIRELGALLANRSPGSHR